MRRANKELLEEVRRKREEQKEKKKEKRKPNINIDLATLDKICSSEPYTLNTVKTVAQFFARKYDLEESRQVNVLPQSQLEKNLQNFIKIQDQFKKPCHFLLESGGSWATLVIIKNEEDAGLVGLYKEFVSGGNEAGKGTEIEGIFTRIFPGGGLRVNSEGSFPSESGVVSLKWMEAQLKCLQSPERNQFISEFSQIDILAADGVDVGKMKTDLKVDLVEHTIEKMLGQLEVEEEAKTMIRKCIELCNNARDKLGKQVTAYERILKEEMRKLEEDPEYEMDEVRISEAQAELKGKLGEEDRAGIDELIKLAVPQYQHLTNEEGDKAEDEQEEEGEKRKKMHFEVFRKCIRLLRGAERTDKLERVLNSIGDKFGVEGGALLEYFSAQSKEKFGGGGDLDSWDGLEELVSKLPPMRSQEKKGEPDPKDKSLDQLLAELAVGRELNLEAVSAEEGAEEHFRKMYLENEGVLEMKRSYDAVKEHFQQWKDADVPTIRSWANKVRGHLDNHVEGIAVMDRVFQLTTGGFRMRGPQLFSVIWFLRQSESGKLAQISTGEGKTVIIGALASLMVLRGDKVDVLTSNEVLAQEGVDEMEKFYKILGISVSTNNEDETRKKSNLVDPEKPIPKECYSKDVVYGTITSFQFDYLRDTSEGQVTRGNRPFGIVILDEVDNLSVDNGGNIAKLAKPFPGMECLKYVYIKIWQELAKAEENVAEEYSKKLEGKRKELEDQGRNDDEADSDNYENFHISLIANYVDELKTQIKSSNPCAIDLIHRHLLPYCDSMLNKWIDNALFAKLECREKEMYIIKRVGEEDSVVPVDYANTGVTMENTQWSNGLHQFVQLKHNLRLTCESLTSSFISNIGYIKLYQSKKIFGLTGTLGSQAARDMLQSAYNVMFKVIPRYKTYNLRMSEGLVVLDSEWTNLVAMEAVLEAISRNRAVLIICKTIKDLDTISANVRACLKLEKYEDGYVKVKTYLDEDECAVVKEKVGPREIIIATNIAGRGTNFKTTRDLEASGGLHVIVSFLPYNKRVQDQAFGRTARQGNQGSAQLILRKQDVLEIDLDPDNDEGGGILSMDDILEKRDEIEKARLRTIKERKLSEINFNDELFTKFASLYIKFNSENGETLGTSYVAADLKEFWAFWLHKQDYSFDKIQSTNVTTEFDNFTLEAAPLLGSCEIMWNPFNEIRRGTMFLHINQLEKGELAVRRGIEMCGDGSLCSSGYMKLFDIEIEKGAQLTERFKKALASLIWIPLKKDETYKENAKVALEKAVEGLEKEVNYLSAILTLQEGESQQDFQRIVTNNGKNLLISHLNGRLTALSTFHEHAKSLLKRLNESMEDSSTIGLAIGSRIPHYLKKLDVNSPDEKQLKQSLTSEELDELQWVGLETLYSLRDFHDAHKETIIGAQIQIGTGLACLAGGFFFPPAMPVLGPIAGALISEGICDIVMELLSRGYTGFDVKAYVKGKCISFGIALATMGISAMATSVKLLDKAAKACRSLAKLLRKCPYLKGVCQKLAGQIDRLANYFDKLKLLAQFRKMKDVDKLEFLKKLKATGEIQKLKQLDGLAKLGQLEHLKSLGKLDVISKTQLLKSMVISVGTETVQSVTMSLITEHLVTAGLNLILEGIRPSIEARVREGLEEARLRDTLKVLEGGRNEVETLTLEVLEGSYGEMAGEVLQEIGLGVARQSRHWALKLTSLALDSVLSLVKIVKYTSTFCERFKLAVASKKKESSEHDSESDLKMKEDLVAILVTDKVYRLIMELAGKATSTLVVGPLMTKVLQSIGGKQGKNVEVDEANEKTLVQIQDAYEALKLGPGASLEDLKKAYRKASLEAHPDRPGGDHGKFLKIGEAYELVLKLHNDLESGSNSSNRPMGQQFLLCSGPGWTNNSPSSEEGSFPISNDPADGGNIAAISSQLKQHIIIQCFAEDGVTLKKVKEYGTKYKDGDKSSAVIGFLPPTLENGSVGHFFQIDGRNTSATTSAPNKPGYLGPPSENNNCLYESLAPQIHGGSMTPQELRQIGGNLTFSNVKYAVGLFAVDFLNNPLMKQLYIKARSSLLVGGNLDKAKEAIDIFMTAILKLDKFKEIPEPVERVKLWEACRNDQNAIRSILGNSFGGNRDSLLNSYKIDGLDSLTNFIFNYKYDEKPFLLEYPNGVKSVIGGNLYSMVAYKGSDNDPPYVGHPRYLDSFRATGLDSLKSLTDPKSLMSLANYPEISGRLISESIRHPATFLSLCMAMNMYPVVSIARSDPDINGNPPVTTSTGIIWLKPGPKYKDDWEVTDYRNPLWLLGQHIVQANTSLVLYKIKEKVVRKITGNDDKNASISRLMKNMSPEEKTNFDTLFRQELYENMKRILDGNNDAIFPQAKST